MEIIIISSVAAVIIIGFSAKMYLNHICGSLNRLIREELAANPPSPDVKKEWYYLSWAKDENGERLEPNPLRVIALADIMSEKLPEYHSTYEKHKLLASSYYSQIKHLIRQRKLAMAIVFFSLARQHGKIGVNIRKDLPWESWVPGDMEVLHATDFMLAKTPVIGKIFKKKVVAALRVDWRLILKGRATADPISTALLLSKIYSLTGEEEYKEEVQHIGLQRDMDRNQLLRIANHLGFKTREELYDFCGI